MSTENKEIIDSNKAEDAKLDKMKFEAIFLEQEKHYLTLLRDIVPFLQEAKDTIDKLSKIKRPISETLEHLIDAIKEETNGI